MKRIQWLLMMIIAVFISTQTPAAPLKPEQVPGPLQPWIEWVLKGSENRLCPFLYNSFQQKRCAWPSGLTIKLDQREGTFSIDWKVFTDSWIQLPGNNKHWPLNITVNQKPALVMEKNGKPVINLPAGNYRIAGEFLWDFIPDNLAIPADTGLIDLTVNGKSIESPAVKKGQLWIKDSDSGKKKPESIQNKLDLQVFRRIIDDVPMEVLTRLDMEISGDQREIRLSLPMPEDFIPMRLQSPLPARVESDGSLLVQVRPGSWHIELLARHDQELEKLTFKGAYKSWPKQEIWVFDARPYQRVVEIENVTPIDPQLTNLPNVWKKLPAYKLKEGETMIFKVTRRGDPDPEPDTLKLQRSLWLDFDGRAYTVNDKISGRMTRGWRLNALPQTKLGQVTLDGKNQLITRLEGSEKQGVEVRKGQINLSADSRISGPVDAINAVGWEQTFTNASAVLNLPPGWRLFAASGIDNDPDSWVSRWTLLDLFLVLIASLAICRLWNVYWGFFALLSLAMIWHEPGAPRFVWLNILAAVALLRVLPEGRLVTFVKFYRNVCWLTLVILAIPFMVDQVRIGIYPQLEKPWKKISVSQYQRLDSAPGAPGPAMEMEAQVMRKSVSKMRSVADALQPSSDYDSKLSVNFDRIDPGANIQTGPGLPQWQWSKINLSWNGSVDSRLEMNFWFLSPTITMLLNFFRVILITVLTLLVFGLLNKRIKFNLPPFLLCLFFVPFLTLHPQNVNADFPDAKLLQELKSRLLEAPECLPKCAQISEMELSIDPDSLVIKLQADTRQNVAVPLPAQIEQWFPKRVAIDGKNAEALYRSNDGRLWVHLIEGKHKIEISGSTPIVNKFSLPLPLKPHRVKVINQGWVVEGVHEHGIPADHLQFSRVRTEQQGEKRISFEPGLLPPFLRVERTLQLGLDWRVSNRVFRVSPPGSAVVLEIPLLSGESVTTPGVRVKDNKVLLNMASQQKEVFWESTLDKNESINLEAPETDQWAEVWRADVSPVWNVKTTGIPVVHHQDQQGRWLPEWHPWPGEKITLTITRPEGVEGQTLTIDKSRLKIVPGQRSREATLEFTLRSSQGTQHRVVLPEQSELLSVVINGKTQPIRKKGAEVILPIKPGKQEISLKWRDAREFENYLVTPAVDLGVNSVNSNINLELGEDRWVLFTMGPVFGPAVLFWGVLIVIVILAIGLGRVSVTPLKHWQWFLLLVGLSQIPIEAAIVVVAWLIVLGVRGKKPLLEKNTFNALQIGIGVLTIISLLLLFVAIRQGLLGSPVMQITGNQSSAYNLNWYQDRSASILPNATVISVSLMSYRLLMLAWSLWLAVSLLNWLKWGWGCFSSGGIWKKAEPKKKILVAEHQQQDKNQ